MVPIGKNHFFYGEKPLLASSRLLIPLPEENELWKSFMKMEYN
jgi:hypothetical protein